eukprot:7212922-Pyramimonas_sp.AAC.1
MATPVNSFEPVALALLLMAFGAFSREVSVAKKLIEPDPYVGADVAIAVAGLEAAPALKPNHGTPALAAVNGFG